MTQVDDYYNQMAARPCSGPGKGRGDRPSVRSLSIDTSLITFRNLDSGHALTCDANARAKIMFIPV